VIHPNGNTAKCLAASSNANGAAVEIEDCVSGAASQLWTVTGFNLQIYGNKCLDDTNGVTTNGQKMQIWTCNSGNSNQQWLTTGGTIQLEGTSKCLDNTNGVFTDGNEVSLGF
jgi:Ricin-type beta-trefoil lectin domain